MQSAPKFVARFFSEAKALLDEGAVKEPLFSRGTYQIEIQEKGKKKVFPFLQMNDEGGLTDSFCSCKTSESGEGCEHLAAAYLLLFNGLSEPLHIRFRKSLWNRLFQMASKRHGYEADALKKEKEGKFYAESKTKKRLFSIEAKSAAAKGKLDEILFNRAVETEETSIKFSNLPLEEITLYRKGEASHLLRYELSFWSDLAKWLMFLDEKKEPYEIRYDGAPIPTEITLLFPSLGIWFYISEVNWPWIIPSLSTVSSPLKVFDQEDEEMIERIEYNESKRSLTIIHKGKVQGQESDFTGYPLGEWLFVEGKGFYRKRYDPLFQKEKILEEEMAKALSSSGKELQKFLPIHLEPIEAKYHLQFDKEANFHIKLYAFTPYDLEASSAAAFLPWVYLPEKGFYLFQELLFEGKEKIVLKKEMAEFINRHRLWLQNFPGFQTHLGSLESHLTYYFSEEEDLIFEAELNFPQEYEEVFNFEEWVYIKGDGFYMKKENRGRLPLHPGLKVAKEEISSFIGAHKEDLEQVQGFYSPSPLFVKMGLNIFLTEEKRIKIVPQIEYALGVDPLKVKQFGDYLYLEKRGFSEIPLSSRVSERYRHETILPEAQEAAFLAFELAPLSPFILEIDPRLKKPQSLKLKIRRLARGRKKKGQEWLVDLAYESELGSVDIFEIWEAFQERKKHLFSPAGLLFLKEARFNWIRQLPKARMRRKKGLIKLSTLEWIRLSVFEEVTPPKGDDPEAIEARKLFEELSRLETDRLLDISSLKSTLRPYQEEGLRWLWFLYCHGLSGLLCDDMGLGKTHQAMALLSAVSYEDEEKRNKYLVVCPTSVIYHWQELLKRFLPKLRVLTFYGGERTLQDFEQNYDLLLTSYGILRLGREDLRPIEFEISIFDEIQIAKNQASQTHRALRRLNSHMRLGLTGTPIENRLLELKALIDIALPFYLPPDPVFRELFIVPIEKHQDEEKKKLLGRLVKPFLLRRRKSEVLLDLPEKIEEIAYSDLSKDQMKLYKEVTEQIRSTVYQELKNEAAPIPYLHVFSALSKLKQIADHPALYLKDPKSYTKYASGKWDLFVELLQEAKDSGQKVVIFSQYLEMIAIIESHLKKKGIGYASIKGSTRDRSEQIRRFREDPACEVFVASLLAAGVGIDLTVASIVIHYDRWWNPAKENQATDRVHRIGQNRGVQVFKLVTKNTIEEHIHEMIERKKGLLEEIIGTEDQINYLSREELLEVFEKIFRGG